MKPRQPKYMPTVWMHSRFLNMHLLYGTNHRTHPGYSR